MDEPETAEAVPNLTFGNYRMGRPVQVDIHDPVVAGLVKAGYLKIRWKEPHEADPLDSAGPGDASSGSVGAGVLRKSQEAQVDDDPGEHRPAEEGPDGD